MPTFGEPRTLLVSNPWLRLVRMDRPIGVYLLMWPTLWALWFAGSGVPAWDNLVIFIIGLLVMRAAGCVINDYADRHIDGLVERTKTRPLPSGEIAPNHALWLFFGLLLVALILVLMTNPLTIALSFGGLAITAIYPFMKRFTNLPQIGLGVAWAWVVPMAFAAERTELPSELWIICAAIITWTIAFDTYYAMVDREDDLQVGVKSTAILFGQFDRYIIASLQLVSLGLMALVGLEFDRGGVYFFGLLVAGGLFVGQYHTTALRDPTACFAAFLNNHRVGMVIFAGIFLDYAMFP
ncbi:MAG: 4-hydroxybenzoate octaprenyltransferase [Porticoccaceae bacterium]|nr:4-hydroxybenzoate octaprenyltransferase [Porticoccaceae bacterium]MDG1475499.1 4-hydroxybenzoate octaprenyltransferase [Porticoccaceae bacterium]